ncbi:MAG: anaerobic ribonucleoside-triphosphate reductase activating protein [Oscillospiraceae bacterium]|nr:anaerobic ribonucleoside-triphosphate reductase activating protein [Oscillospiraceae bacterium]
MNYGEIKKADIANGLGVRISLFVSGCTHHCDGCFNEQTWDFNFGKPYTKQTEDEIISLLKSDYIRGLSLLGGEPFEIKNQAELVKLLRRVKTELPNKDVWCYSGYLFEELCGKTPSRAFGENTLEMLSLIDVLVDGEYVKDLYSITLKFRGSSNQRLIDVKASLKEGEVVLLNL